MGYRSIIRLGTEEEISGAEQDKIIKFCDEYVDIEFVKETDSYGVGEADYLKEQIGKIGGKFPNISFILYYSYFDCSAYIIYKFKAYCVEKVEEVYVDGDLPSAYGCALSLRYDFCPNNEINFE